MAAVAAITALEHPQANRKRLRIWVDGEPFRTTNRRVGRALDLAVGDRVETEEFAAALDDQEVRQAREHALRYLTYRARSRSELERRLREVGYGEAAVRETIAFLVRVGYVDDAGFAEAWIADRVARGYGRRRIIAELVQKGVEPEAVSEFLERHCPEEQERSRALAIGRRRLRKAVGLERLAAARSLTGYLMRRGFAGAVVRSVVDEVTGEADPIEAESA